MTAATYELQKTISRLIDERAKFIAAARHGLETNDYKRLERAIRTWEKV